MLRPFPLLPPALFALAILPACAPDEPTNNNCNNGQCENDPEASAVILGASVPWLECQLTPGDGVNTRDAISCTLPANEYPVRPASISFLTSYGDDRTPQNPRLDENTPTRLVAAMDPGSYPVTLEITLTIVDRGDALDHTGLSGQYRYEIVVEDGREARFSIAQPFDLWPIEVKATDYFYGAAFPEQSMDLGPSVIAPNNGDSYTGSAQIEAPQRTWTTTQDTAISPNENVRWLVPVPSERESGFLLQGTAIFGSESQDRVPFEISGPGIYTASAQGLFPEGQPRSFRANLQIFEEARCRRKERCGTLPSGQSVEECVTQSVLESCPPGECEQPHSRISDQSWEACAQAHDEEQCDTVSENRRTACAEILRF